jgi:chromosome condensin MukBEF MukE localization factor
MTQRFWNPTMTAKIKKFPEIKRLSDEETAYLIMLFIEHEDSIDLVKEQFEKVSHKIISLDTLVEIRSLHSDKILSKKEELAKKIGKIPMSKLHVRLRRMDHIYKLCLEEKLRYTIKVGRDEFEEFIGPDLKNARGCIMDCDAMMNNARKMAHAESRESQKNSWNEDDEDNEEDGVDFEDDEKAV